MVIGFILACEVLFWVAVVSGLVARYVAGRPRLGLLLLASTLLIDVALLVAVAIDLGAGGTAGTAHMLAMFYLGFSLAYGKRMIAWADERFQYWFRHGPRPKKLYGSAYARRCWLDVPRTAFACGLASLLAWILTAMTDDPARTEALASTFSVAGIIVGIEVVVAVSYTVWPRRRAAVSPRAE